jgi:geranylgeranyl diphosphate synthase type I
MSTALGDEGLAGKAADGDFVQSKRTLPVLAAYARAPTRARAELERLWSLPPKAKDAVALAQARALVEEARQPHAPLPAQN